MKALSRTVASPRARRAMRQRGLDPATVRGSGPNGRIVEADVQRAATPISPLPLGERQPRTSPLPLGEGQPRISPLPLGEGQGVRALSSMRRAVAAKVAESFATIPHFYLRSEADVTALVQLRAQAVDSLEARCGCRPSLTDFLLRALILALRDCPHANRIWQNDTIVQLPTVDVGLVVQLEDGLMVPILRRADGLDMIDLIRRRAEVVGAVRSGRASADLFQGGATSLSNLGPHRVDEFTPIISPPQSSMLAAGRVAERPAAHEGRLCLRHTVHLTLSVDHRVMDGVPAAAFFDRIVHRLENPFLLLCNPAGQHP